MNQIRVTAALRLWLSSAVIAIALLLASTFQVMMLGAASRTMWLLFGGDAVLLAVIAYLTRRSARTISEPVNDMIDAVARIEQGTGDLRLVHERSDEFGDLSRAFSTMAEVIERERERRQFAEDEFSSNSKRLDERAGELESHRQVVAVTRQMAHRLSTCANETEWADVCARFIPQLSQIDAGALYGTDETGRFLRPVGRWSTSHSVDTTFEADDCWALRRGAPHVVLDPKADVVCRHYDSRLDRAYCCVPLIAQGETLGLISLEGSGNSFRDSEVAELPVLAEAAAIAFANLRLRSSLRDRALRDPATNLFSRRFLEEAWTLEAPRSERSNSTLALALVEIDNFGAFNNHYGRDAADTVIITVGRALQAKVRAGDVVCRYGADRFALLQPGMNQINARTVAERLCTEIRSTPLRWGDVNLGNATISIGIAVFPYVGPSFDAVMSGAGDALRDALKAGGDRAELATPIEGTLFPLPRV